MKILYAVQATGNGHISRAMELLPFLKQYGEVDIFLSGTNSSLLFDHPIKYRSKGISLFFNCNGSLNYWKTACSLAPYRLWKEVRELPVEKYDLVLNDFESITAMACAQKKIHSVNFGHQASFMSDLSPRPNQKSWLGEWLLKNYARASSYVGLHFQRYDNFILPPVIKKEIIEAEPADKGFIAVYLPSYCEKVLTKFFHTLTDFCFRIFSHDVDEIKRNRNITFLPVDKKFFNESLINCTGIITGAGFETPAEALKLGKKLMVIPITGHYEQQCNAAALEKIGIKKIDRLDDDFHSHFYPWISSCIPPAISYGHSTETIIEEAIKLSIAQVNERKNNFAPGNISPILRPLS